MINASSYFSTCFLVHKVFIVLYIIFSKQQVISMFPTLLLVHTETLTRKNYDVLYRGCWYRIVCLLACLSASELVGHEWTVLCIEARMSSPCVKSLRESSVLDKPLINLSSKLYQETNQQKSLVLLDRGMCKGMTRKESVTLHFLNIHKTVFFPTHCRSSLPSQSLCLCSVFTFDVVIPL